MIIDNGYIRFIHSSGGGLDAATGHPIAATERYGKQIPCQYYHNSVNLQAKVNGESVTRKGTTILIEETVEPHSERIQLCDRSGGEVGTFSVISIEPLEAVGQERITV